jgi:mannose/fructose/N-acetylgalactosamine-specific phosphotransferase system component IID
MSASINPEIAVTAGDDAALEQAVLRKVTRRLIPLLFVLYMINMLDRTNVGHRQVADAPGS